VPADEVTESGPGPLEVLLDRMARRMGARRWVVCWQDRGEWVSHSAEGSVLDEVVLRLAPKLAARPGVSLLATADLGDLGVRLGASGIERLLVVAEGGADGGSALVFENPDQEAVRAFVAGPGGQDLGALPGLCRRLLRAERWASDLFVHRELLPHLAAVAFAGADESQALQALGDLSDHRSVLILAPLVRGISIQAVHRNDGRWRGVNETMATSSWEEAWEDPDRALDQAARHIGLEEAGPWVAGRAAAFQPRVVLGLEPGRARLSQEGADVLATVLSRTLAERRLAASIQQSTLARERTRIASVIHEGLSQVLSNVAIQLEVLDQVSDDPRTARGMVRSARSAVLEALDSLRGAVFEMTPAVPEWGDLATGLDRYVADYAAQWGLNLAFEAEGPGRDVSAELLALAYAFVQEGLTNIRKHAEAPRGVVKLLFEPSWLSISVCDEGIGFDPSGRQEEGFREHQGLALTRTRVTLMGGRFEVRSARGRGTCLAMRVPA
jgi:signal transduction histidine kinase